jgi:hypothetical protein
VLGGAWTTTETVDGDNSSLWRGSLQVVQQGREVVGRWEPPRGEPERVVVGTLVDGIVRATQRGTAALPAAAVAEAPSRAWLLSLSADGTLLTGRWTEQTAGASRQGSLVATGEARCAAEPASSGEAAAGAEPAAPQLPTVAPMAPTAALSACAAWDLSGTWEVAGEPSWRLRLWQDGEAVLGWYEPAAGDAALPSWVVDGSVRGRTVLLRHHLGDSATVARTLVLAPDGAALTGAWPLPFGPAEREVLAGQARCVQ